MAAVEPTCTQDIAVGDDAPRSDVALIAPVPSKARTLLAWSSYWIVMGVSLGLTAVLEKQTPYCWYVMAQVNVVLVMLFEELLPMKKGDSMFRDRQSWNDVAHMLFYKIIARPLIWAVALSIVTFVGSRWPNTSRIWPSSLPVPLQFLVFWLIFDLVGYSYHRALHHFDFLFAFHALHHDTPKIHVLKANRLHAVEESVNFLLVVPAMILAGCPASMMTWLGMFEVFSNNLAHSNIEQRFPRWFHYVTLTAHVHHLHHSDQDSLQRSNLAGLPIWDLVFGTYRHPADHRLTTTGIENYPVPRGFLAQLCFPFVKNFGAKSSRAKEMPTPLPGGDRSRD
jgi:sterol desaturase/sphingolipid hydroxylase (fatty acid hydroxylase superfamily)